MYFFFFFFFGGGDFFVPYFVEFLVDSSTGNTLTNIFQEYSTGTEAIIWLPQPSASEVTLKNMGKNILY